MNVLRLPFINTAALATCTHKDQKRVERVADNLEYDVQALCAWTAILWAAHYTGLDQKTVQALNWGKRNLQPITNAVNAYRLGRWASTHTGNFARAYTQFIGSIVSNRSGLTAGLAAGGYATISYLASTHYGNSGGSSGRMPQRKQRTLG